MKRIVLFLVFCLASVACCFGQNVRSWTAGPLTWDDFSPARLERADTSATSYASFSLIRKDKTVRTKGVTYMYRDVTAALVPVQSWVKPEGRNDQALRNHQQEFDILQYFATLYRDDFMFYNDTLLYRYEDYFGNESKHRLVETVYMAKFKDAVAEFRRTGDASAYPVSREPFDITRFPFQVAPAALEAHIGFVSIFPTGDLARIYSPAHGFYTGFGYREGKDYFSADLSLSLAGALISGFDARDGSEFTATAAACLGFSAKYGRVLFSPWGTSLSVFAGVGYTSWVLTVPETVKGATLTEGVCLDVPLHSTVNFLARRPRVQNLALQFKVYADEMYQAAQKIFVPTINVSAGLNIGYRKISKVR